MSGGAPNASWDDSASDSLNISPNEGMTTRLRRISLHLAFIVPLLALIGLYCAIIGLYWPLLCIIGLCCAFIAPDWPLLVAIGRYWPLLLLTRTFRGYLSDRVDACFFA